jgi:glycosyltransferase involved in cell wall biosynthesis
MTRRPKVAHLLDDFALGGVTRNLALFGHSALADLFDSVPVEVHPEWGIAPRLDAKVIVTHFPPSWRNLSFLFSLRARNPNAAIIHVEHSYSREWAEMSVPDIDRFRLMLKIALGQFDRIICVARAQEAWLRQLCPQYTARTQTIEPWSEMAGLEKLQLPGFAQSEPLVIGAYGRFVAQKGFAELIAAARLLGAEGNVQFRIHGVGAPEEEAQLRRLASGLRHVEIGGRVDDVPAFLAGCDLIAVPSRYETFGLVAAEARLAGRPIVVSPVGGLPEQAVLGGRIVDFRNSTAAAAELANIRRWPLVQMAVDARHSAIGITGDRIAKWRALLGDCCLVQGLARAAA